MSWSLTRAARRHADPRTTHRRAVRPVFDVLERRLALSHGEATGAGPVAAEPHGAATPHDRPAAADTAGPPVAAAEGNPGAPARAAAAMDSMDDFMAAWTGTGADPSSGAAVEAGHDHTEPAAAAADYSAFVASHADQDAEFAVYARTPDPNAALGRTVSLATDHADEARGSRPAATPDRPADTPDDEPPSSPPAAVTAGGPTAPADDAAPQPSEIASEPADGGDFAREGDGHPGDAVADATGPARDPLAAADPLPGLVVAAGLVGLGRLRVRRSAAVPSGPSGRFAGLASGPSSPRRRGTRRAA